MFTFKVCQERENSFKAIEVLPSARMQLCISRLTMAVFFSCCSPEPGSKWKEF